MESIAPLGPAKQNLILLGINFSQFLTPFLCILVNLVQLLLQRKCKSLHQCQKKTSKTTSVKHHTWLTALHANPHLPTSIFCNPMQTLFT